MIKPNSPKLLRALFLSITLAAACSQVTAVAQSNLRFLADTPGASLNKAQLRALSEAIKKSLDAGMNGQTDEWNPTPAGTTPARAVSAKITPHFTDNKPPCAIVDLEITAKGMTQPSKLAYCQNEKKEWALTNR
ncbi:hypothetical protein ACIPEN_00825 [Herbaspirillum chlorophenolicum]|uniref:Surface antigen domain-containing protein n=1 Tax=Herbaspirillum chlorophenolicum TaxID=211589 RepID=A0ABW8EW86_9BURK|nr:hypothetical protein [Herbaspirillum chlorophenolicum]